MPSLCGLVNGGGSDSEAETGGWGKGDPGKKPGIQSYRASAPPYSVLGTWAWVSSLALRVLICKDDGTGRTDVSTGC